MKMNRVLIVVFAVAALWGVGEAQMTKSEKLQVPPIDLNQTGVYKTATFAMG